MYCFSIGGMYYIIVININIFIETPLGAPNYLGLQNYTTITLIYVFCLVSIINFISCALLTLLFAIKGTTSRNWEKVCE